MANLVDYLTWRGDLSLKEHPFNEVDSLLLNEITYAHFEYFVKGDEKVTVKEAIKRFFQIEHNEEFTLGTTCLSTLGKSPRFFPLIMHDLVSEYDDHCQFAAVCYDIPDETTYVAFRGTDETIEGWREDFETSYHETKGQKLAIEYLDRVMNDPSKTYIIGGHSKGGNTAMYTAMHLPKRKQDWIKTIYNYDGPGIAPELLLPESFNRIKDKIVKYVPEYSIVGQLFPLDIEEHVIKSKAKGAMQHDSINWQITRDALVPAKGLDKNCITLNKVLMDWIESTTFSERESFTKDFFDQLRADGDVTISDIEEHAVQEVFSMVGNIFKFNDESKSAIKKLVKSITKHTLNIRFSLFNDIR